jgi:hypothetical protein
MVVATFADLLRLAATRSFTRPPAALDRASMASAEGRAAPAPVATRGPAVGRKKRAR